MKKVLIVSILIVAVACQLVFFGCGGGSGKEIYSIDLQGATSLFIGSSTSTSMGARTGSPIAFAESSGTKLLKMTADGYVEEVVFYDESGKAVTTSNAPNWVREVNDAYLCLKFTDYFYLVNKQTGRCYRSPEGILSDDFMCNNRCYVSSVPQEELFLKDASGNVYFVNTSGVTTSPLKKMNLSDINAITVTNASAINDNLDYNAVPAVAANGDVAYYGKDGQGTSICRYVSASGQIANIPLGWTDFWTGYDGNIYCFNRFDDGTYVAKVVFENGVVGFEKYGSTAVTESPLAQYYVGSGNHGRVYLKNKNKIVQVCTNGLSEVYNSRTNATAYVSYESLGLKTIKLYSYSEKYIYLYGTDNENNSVLVKVDPQDGNYTSEVIARNQYDFETISVGANDTISFSGLKMANGSYIVGVIAADGRVTESKITFDNQIDVLINL